MRYRSPVRFVMEGLEGLVVLVAAVCTWPVSKRWLENWGSHSEERERAWPGDRFVAPTQAVHTRGIDIDAPGHAVWPWVVQFGLDRAGFYSYELLERMAGIPVTNVESIEPCLQSLAVGDEVRLHPKAPGIPVAEVQEGSRVCFGVRADMAVGVARPDPERSWSIYIEQTSAGSSRLVVRGCIGPLREESFLKRVGAALEKPIDLVMEQRMLRTVKRLSEATVDRASEGVAENQHEGGGFAGQPGPEHIR